MEERDDISDLWKGRCGQSRCRGRDGSVSDASLSGGFPWFWVVAASMVSRWFSNDGAVFRSISNVDFWWVMEASSSGFSHGCERKGKIKWWLRFRCVMMKVVKMLI